MNRLLPILAGALIAGAALPALAQMSPGPYDNFIKEVQVKLIEQGFYAGPVNGDFGEQTQAALAQFQLANVLPASGALDGATLLALDVVRPAPEESAAVGSSAPAEGKAAAD